MKKITLVSQTKWILLSAILFSFLSQAKTVLPIETNRIWLNVTGAQGAFSQTLYGYRTGATDGFDQGVDGAYFNDGAIALASLLGDVRYVIQFKGLPFSIEDVVPLSFSATNSGTYTFAIDHFDGFFTNQNFAVYLFDSLTNTYTNLKTSNYTFNCSAGRFDNRFQMSYGYTSSLNTSNNTLVKINLDVHKENDKIVIQLENSTLQQVTIYNLEGKIIYDFQTINNNKITLVPNSIFNQTLIIKAKSTNGITFTKKWYGS